MEQKQTSRFAELYEDRAADKCGSYRCNPEFDTNCSCLRWASERTVEEKVQIGNQYDGYYFVSCKHGVGVVKLAGTKATVLTYLFSRNDLFNHWWMTNLSIPLKFIKNVTLVNPDMEF